MKITTAMKTNRCMGLVKGPVNVTRRGNKMKQLLSIIGNSSLTNLNIN